MRKTMVQTLQSLLQLRDNLRMASDTFSATCIKYVIRFLAALQKLSKKGTFLPFITMIMVIMTKPTTAANKVNHKKKKWPNQHDHHHTNLLLTLMIHLRTNC